MKRIFALLIIVMLLFTSCGEKVEPIEDVSHAYMDNIRITVPEGTSGFASAVFLAADRIMNEVINTKIKKKIEFISFEFSGDVFLSLEERQLMKELFSCYGVEITDGLRSDLTDIERGVTIGFGSIQNASVDGADLSIPIKIYYSNDYYTHCCDYKIVDGEYIMYDAEYWHKTRYIY
jgi:hypothetical protein